MSIKRLILLPIFIFGAIATTLASGVKGNPETLYKYRFNANIQVKLVKGLKLNVEPELRLNDGYEMFLINGRLKHKTFNCIYWGATYRFAMDYESEIYHRYAFDVTYKDDFGRFTPSFKLRYNNYADENNDDKGYLRYRAKVEYDINNCKLTPFLAIEAYHQVAESQLHKMRYATGVEFKLNKNSSISLDYKFDMFMKKYKNTNIFSLGYKYKF